jgi:hypothetical protein
MDYTAGDKVFYKEKIYLVTEDIGEYLILANFSKTIEFPARKNLCAPTKVPPCSECGNIPPMHRNGCRSGIMATASERILTKVNNAKEFKEALGEHYEPPTGWELNLKRDRVISSHCFVAAIHALLELARHGECPAEWSGGFCDCQEFVPSKEQVEVGKLALLKLAEIGFVLAQTAYHPPSPFPEALPAVLYLQQQYLENRNEHDHTMGNKNSD